MSLKRCQYCRKLFEPNPRTAYEQRACFETECKKKRKKDAQRKWCEKNPTYFHAQYPRVKEWLDEHPGYLKNYRRNNRDHAGTGKKKEKRRKQSLPPEARARLEARVIEIEQFFRGLPCCDIQDTIEAKNSDLKPLCAQFTFG